MSIAVNFGICTNLQLMKGDFATIRDLSRLITRKEKSSTQLQLDLAELELLEYAKLTQTHQMM
jgi:uncharacterized protein YfkK (UPF0435 family)